VSLLHFVSAAGPLRPVRNGQRYVMLFSHGNAEDIAHSYDFFDHLCARLEVDVVAYDYSGYGCSSGTCSEDSTFACADAAFSFITDTINVPKSNIILCGRSLGSGPTTHLAAKHRGLAGMILLAPLSTAASVAGSVAGFAAYPFDIFTNVRKIDKVRDYPVHIIHGTKDEVIPMSHGESLLKTVQKVNPKATATWAEGAGHNDIEQVMGRQFYRVLADFIATLHLPMPPPPPAEVGWCGLSSSPRTA